MVEKEFILGHVISCVGIKVGKAKIYLTTILGPSTYVKEVRPFCERALFCCIFV